LKFAIPACNLPPIEWYTLAGSGLQRKRAAAVDDRRADREMLRPHHSVDPNWGHSELGAQSGRKNQPACLQAYHHKNFL